MQWDLKSTQIMTLSNLPIRNSIMRLSELIYMTRGRIIVTGKNMIHYEFNENRNQLFRPSSLIDLIGTYVYFFLPQT